MKARAAVWNISREVMELMLRDWFKKTRCQDDPGDLRLIETRHDGRNVVALVELVDPFIIEDRNVKRFVDQLIREA